MTDVHRPPTLTLRSRTGAAKPSLWPTLNPCHFTVPCFIYKTKTVSFSSKQALSNNVFGVKIGGTTKLRRLFKVINFRRSKFVCTLWPCPVFGMCAAGLATHLTTPVCPVARTQTIILQVVYSGRHILESRCAERCANDAFLTSFRATLKMTKVPSRGRGRSDVHVSPIFFFEYNGSSTRPKEKKLWTHHSGDLSEKASLLLVESSVLCLNETFQDSLNGPGGCDWVDRDPLSYRPISCLARVLEKALNMQIRKYLEVNKLFYVYDHQSGFLPQHSTVTHATAFKRHSWIWARHTWPSAYCRPDY